MFEEPSETVPFNPAAPVALRGTRTPSPEARRNDGRSDITDKNIQKKPHQPWWMKKKGIVPGPPQGPKGGNPKGKGRGPGKGKRR